MGSVLSTLLVKLGTLRFIVSGFNQHLLKTKSTSSETTTPDIKNNSSTCSSSKPIIKHHNDYSVCDISPEFSTNSQNTTDSKKADHFDQPHQTGTEPQLVQCIPVGQSLDAPDDTNNDEGSVDNDEEYIDTRALNEDLLKIDQYGNNPQLHQEHEYQQQQVPNEEAAAIRIQALVRGHLARKALRGDHTPLVRNSNTNTQISKLNQSQFDELSLLNNPPNLIFSPNSPFNLTPTHPEHFQQSLGPIAEVPLAAEQTLQKVTQSTAHVNPDVKPDAPETNSTIHETASKSLDLGDSLDRRESLSSASVMIGDYSPATFVVKNSLTTSNNAPERVSSAFNTNNTPTLATSIATSNNVDFLDHDEHQDDESPVEEAAAIRIQSAFRGYRARKNSPYRARGAIGERRTVSMGAEVVQVNGGSYATSNGNDGNTTTFDGRLSVDNELLGMQHSTQIEQQGSRAESRLSGESQQQEDLKTRDSSPALATSDDDLMSNSATEESRPTTLNVVNASALTAGDITQSSEQRLAGESVDDATSEAFIVEDFEIASDNIERRDPSGDGNGAILVDFEQDKTKEKSSERRSSSSSTVSKSDSNEGARTTDDAVVDNEAVLRADKAESSKESQQQHQGGAGGKRRNRRRGKK